MLTLPVACLPTSANGAQVDGCSSSAVEKVSPWGKNVNVLIAPASGMDETAEFRLGATARYWFCPNGSDPNKIKVTHFGLCITKMDNRDPLTFRGVEYNPYFTELNGDTTVNPPSDTNGWNGAGDIGDSRCSGRDISVDDRKWMRMPQDPVWSLSGWLKYDYAWPDDDITWKAGDNSYRYFNPPEDPILNPFG